MPVSEKRSIKAIIDVVPNRLGIAVGSGLITLLTIWWPERLYPGLPIAAMACSGLALIAARRLNHAYVQSLERSLLDQASGLDLRDLDGSLSWTQ